ncbi:MAG: heparinase II/III family protein [Verrucomicrobiota bacterium]
MKREPFVPGDSSGFANRTGNSAEETTRHVWETAAARTLATSLAAPAPGTKVWALSLPVKSNRATMLMVEVCLDCDESAAGPVTCGYQTSFVVEWSGWNTLYFTASSLKLIGQPAGLHAVRRLRLTAGTTTFAGTVLELGRVSWPSDSPLVPVTPYEDMVVNFLSERMWDRGDWTHTGHEGLPVGEQSFDVAWMFANLRYLQRPGRRHQTAYTRKMNVDLSGYQAVTVWTATDLRANFSVILEIDGVAVRVIDRRRGLGGGDEIRALISGRRLTALTFELEQAEGEITEALEVQVASSIRWVLLERTGTDPARVGQAEGIPAIPPPSRVEPLESTILPVGIMIGREEFLQLREKAKRPGPLKKMADEIIAEAVDHLDYAPERYAGRYLPVDLGNQGCERRVSPSDQMYHLSSCMVYGGMAYALTGDRRHGQTARRGLFSALRCRTWQGGFPSRIPAGLPGYRAPFIETDAAEVVALCYDFIYPLLSDAERREVEDALYEKALPWIDMYLRLHGEGYLLNSNQGAVYTAGLAYAALVSRRSHADVDAILERGIQWFPRMMNQYYKVTGASNEGPGYWEFTTKYAVSALIAISRHKGWAVPDYAPAHLGRTMDYLMHTRSLARERLSFLPLSDNIEGVGFNFMNSSFMFFAKYYRDPNALWLWHEYFARRPNPPGSPFFGKKVAGAYTTSGLMDFLLFVEGTPARPQLPLRKHFEVCDRILLRTGSSYGDVLFLFEGGPQTFDHTHSDKGQFILEAYGERFAADPGVIKYQDPACLNFKHTSYHNLVTLRGRDQDYRDPKQAVVLDRVAFGEACDYLSADLRNSYRACAQYRRQILFVRPHYFLVVDDVQADEPGLEWNYHSCAPIAQIDLPAGLIRLQGAKAAMILAIGSDRPLAAATGQYASDGVVLTHNLVLTPLQPAATLRIAALLLPFPLPAGPGDASPSVTVSRQPDAVQFTVRGPWGVDQVRCDLSATAGPPGIQVTRESGLHRAIVFPTRDEPAAAQP